MPFKGKTLIYFMKIRNHKVEKPGRVVACLALGIGCYFGVIKASSYFKKPEVEKKQEIVQIEDSKKNNEPYFKKEQTPDDLVYLIKTEYNTLPVNEKKKVLDYFFSDMLEHKCESFSFKVKNSISYIFSRLEEKLEKFDYESIQDNYSRLEDFIGGAK